MLVAVACVIGGGFVAWKQFPRDETARATKGEALERFRQRAEAAGEGPGGAALGVYAYRTRGSESADTGLLDSTHEYDGLSTITLTRARCGVRERWQVLASRWGEARFCVPPNGTGLRSIAEFHEFFGRGGEDSFECRGNTPSKRLLRTVGTRFSSRCRNKRSTAESHSKVVGVDEVVVGGDPVTAIHTTTNVELEGDVEGGTTRDDWRRRSDGLLLRRVVETDAKRSGAIDADYEESYTIQLVSVTPER